MSEEKGTRGQRAYALRVENQTWEQIADLMGGDTDSVLAVARKFARAQGLPWPVKRVKPTPGPSGPTKREEYEADQRNAYETRAAGFKWGTVSTMLGYSYAPHAIAAARKHAARQGLPWPIVLEKSQGENP